jgi:hypothetical protein
MPEDTSAEANADVAADVNADVAADADADAIAPEVSQPRYPPPPIAVPALNARGCVEQAATYSAALESHQQRVRDQAVSSAGAQWTTRTGFFLDPSTERDLGEQYSVRGRQFAVVGYSSDRSNSPQVRLAQKGNTLHVVTDRARAIPVTVHSCGMNPCPRGSGVRVFSRPVAIELKQGESMGPELVLHYDFWWAQLSYEKRRRCPPPPPAARSR